MQVDITGEICEPKDFEQFNFHHIITPDTDPEVFCGAFKYIQPIVKKLFLPMLYHYKVSGYYEPELVFCTGEMLSNAADSVQLARTPKPRIELAGQRLSMHQDQRDWVRFIILDNGLGFEKEGLKFSFTEDFPTKKKDIKTNKQNNIPIVGGEGLGLKLVNRRMSEIGGQWFRGNRTQAGGFVGFQVPISRQ
jgi:hypothetical protein